MSIEYVKVLKLLDDKSFEDKKGLKMTDKLKIKLTRIIAQMIKKQLSDYPDNYPKTLPKSTLKIIQDYNKLMNSFIVDLIEIRDLLQ